MMRLLPAAVLMAVLVTAAASPALADEEAAAVEVDGARIGWLPHREAVTTSRTEGKPLVMYFTAAGDSWCRKLERNTFGDRDVVRYLNTHFIATEIDVDEVPALARKFGVEGLPTLWFLDAEGGRLTSLDGYLGPENLMPLLEFIVTKGYEWTDYETWRERRK
jgi:thioredoxin-related protein